MKTLLKAVTATVVFVLAFVIIVSIMSYISCIESRHTVQAADDSIVSLDMSIIFHDLSIANPGDVDHPEIMDASIISMDDVNDMNIEALDIFRPFDISQIDSVCVSPGVDCDPQGTVCCWPGLCFPSVLIQTTTGPRWLHSCQLGAGIKCTDNNMCITNVCMNGTCT